MNPWSCGWLYVVPPAATALLTISSTCSRLSQDKHTSECEPALRSTGGSHSRVPAHELGEPRRLPRPLVLEPRNRAPPILDRPVLPKLELPVQSRSRHLKPHDRTAHAVVEVGRQALRTPAVWTVPFVSANKLFQYAAHERVVLSRSRQSVRVDDAVVPCRNRRGRFVPGRRDVAMRALEDEERRSRAIHQPPMVVRPGHVPHDDEGRARGPHELLQRLLVGHAEVLRDVSHVEQGPQRV